MDREAFADLVHDALSHLRNRLHLAKHPLATRLADADSTIAGDELHDWLLGGIEQLKPLTGAAGETPDWRRYRLLVLRYVEGQGLEQVAHTLGVSVRQCTRDQQQAVKDLVEILSLRLADAPTVGTLDGEPQFPEGEPREHGLTGEIVKLTAKEEKNSDLAETVDGALATLGSLAVKQRVTFKSLVADALPPVAMNRTLLRQAILSLLAYSAEIAPGSQITLAGTDAGRGVTLRILVRTTGGDFCQVGDLTTPTPETEELLHAARRLLQSQDGSVELSDPRSGQPLFTAILPPVQLQTILVIDDNPDVVSLFRRYLRGQRFRVIQATSGTTALRLSRNLRPGIIVLDVMIPMQDGWEILQKLRSQDETRKTPVVICSVLPERSLARSLGVDEFLTKPFTRQELLATLERCFPAEGGHQALR